MHTFNAAVRLDVPTFVDPVVQRKLDDVVGSRRGNVAWDALQGFCGILSTGVRLLSQVSVLVSVLQSQKDGPIYAIVSFLEVLYHESKTGYNYAPLGSGQYFYYSASISV
jgi:hypothetical protein